MQTVRIRKYKNNQYVKSRSGIWLRKPNSLGSICEIDTFSSEEDCKLFANNELENRKSKHKKLDISSLKWRNVAIVSDGLNFKEYMHETNDCDTVIAINRSLCLWDTNYAFPRYFIANNPFVESMSSIPQMVSKTICIASTRTYPKFIKSFGGDVMFYRSASDDKFSSTPSNVTTTLSDYRNPICAALHLSYLAKVQSIKIISHDMAFTDYRPGVEEVKKGVYMYPSQIKSMNLVEDFANLMLDEISLKFVGETSS